MDGPNVNLKFLKEVSSNREANLNHKLVDIGTCSLHVVHGGFKTGEMKSEFGVSKVLKGAFQLLHDTPARREDYEAVTSSTAYPLSFCGTQWVENSNCSLAIGFKQGMCTDKILL